RGVLQVITRRSDKGVEVDVIDTGHGIAPEHMGRIYDPFFTTKGVKKGTGLGLSVTYGIIQEHGGAIEAVSKPGEGTCFHLEFPAGDLVLHELIMPDKSGMEVLRDVRERDRHTPIFMITAWGGVKAAVQAVKLGATDYVSKPWDNDKLIIEIERAISGQRLLD